MPLNPKSEIEKKLAVHDKCLAIGAFIGWLHDTKKVQFATWDDDDLVPFQHNINDLLAEHFDIDLEKLEQERQVLLAGLVITEQTKEGLL
jgi:hypothetical protein